MDTSAVVDFIKEIAFLLIVFGGFFAVAIFKGKQTLINLTLGLYLGLLLSLQFPYYQSLTSSTGPEGESVLKMCIFGLFTLFSTILFSRLMPREFSEKAFEGFMLKFLFALGATVLVMTFSYNVLPVTEFITPGSPIQTLFAPADYFFWWLLAPLVLLFLL